MSPEYRETFTRSEARAFDGQPLRVTDRGIWLPMPLDVVHSALDVLRSTGFWSRLGVRPKVLDAGMGDGRLVAAFCTVPHPLWAYGIESHPKLCELAQANLRALTERGLSPNWSTCQGDYLDPSTYPKLGVRLEDIDAFFNYPDGNEQKLAAFLREHARNGALLVLLTPDHGLQVDGLILEDDVAIAREQDAPSFRLMQYRIHRTPGREPGDGA